MEWISFDLGAALFVAGIEHFSHHLVLVELLVCNWFGLWNDEEANTLSCAYRNENASVEAHYCKHDKSSEGQHNEVDGCHLESQFQRLRHENALC